MKKKKEEILHNKEQPKEQSTVQSTEKSTEQSSKHSSVQPTEQSSVQSSVKSNNTYVCGISAIGVCVFYIYNTFQPKKFINDHLVTWHEQKQPPKRRHVVWKN